MTYLLMESPCFSTQALMRSGIPNIRLSSANAEMLRHAEQTFWIRVASDFAGHILSTSSWTIAQRFSMGQVWAVARPCSLRPEGRDVIGLATPLSFGGGISWGSILLKMDCEQWADV